MMMSSGFEEEEEWGFREEELGEGDGSENSLAVQFGFGGMMSSGSFMMM